MDNDFDRNWNANDDVARRPQAGSNIVLMGAMGAGKTTVGWHLARLIGFGFIDLDTLVERREKKEVAKIFADGGESAFRDAEREAVKSLDGIRSHVISVGGGAVMDTENWETLKDMGTTVWLNTPPEEIARRFNSDEELRKRPLLAELADRKKDGDRMKLLTERLNAIIGMRTDRYRQARLTVADSFSTPELTAQLIKEHLVRENLFTPLAGVKPYDRWDML